MRDVRLLDGCDLFRCEANGNGRGGILQMIRLCGSHNGRGDRRLGKQPGKRKLRTGNATLFTELTEPIDDLAVGLFGLGVEEFRESICLRAQSVFTLPRPGEAATCQRTPGNHADAFGLT